MTLEDAKNLFIFERLSKCRWNRMRTAESLQVSIRYLRIKINEMRELGFDIPPSVYPYGRVSKIKKNGDKGRYSWQRP